MARAGLSVSSEELAARLETYFRLLAAWNTRMNLTALDVSRSTPDAIDRILIEPLVAAGCVPPSSSRAIDIGSGGGTPAIPLLLAVPRLTGVLVEAKGRKTVFLKEALRAVHLTTSDVIACRYEELVGKKDLKEVFDLLTIRAVRVDFSALIDLQSFLRPGGQMFLFRSGADQGGRQVGELAVSAQLTWLQTLPLDPVNRAELVVLKKHSN